MLYEEAVKEKQEIEREIQWLRNEIANLPMGNMYISSSGKYTKWFYSSDKEQIYIPKKDRYFAEQLALKKYYSLQLQNREQELKAIHFYLKYHNANAFQEESDLIQSSQYRELLLPHFQPIDKELLEWMQEPYERNPWHPEHLIHQSISGNMVRSKSEAMIDTVLFQYKIPYRYECSVELGDVTYYPDFTTRRPKTGTVKFWEHNGFMDNPAYCRRSFLKQQQYAEHGIIPGINMIVTYETKDHPLTFKMIQEIVERHILE